MRKIDSSIKNREAVCLGCAAFLLQVKCFNFSGRHTADKKDRVIAKSRNPTQGGTVARKSASTVSEPLT